MENKKDYKAIFQQYALLKQKEKMIQLEIESLGKQLIDYMINEKIDQVSTEFGIFSRATRKIWQFSPKVIEAENRVRFLKNKEMADGTASFKENYYLIFNRPK